VANDGRVAFTYQDDIWVVDADGANPHRLTVNIARDFSPRFSPDGKWIAFTSARTGNNDVFVMPSTGGEPKQLTWFSGDDQALYWTPDGKGIVMSSARGSHAWGSPLYVQPIDGTIARPLGMGIARSGMISQDGSMIAYNRNLPSTWRKSIAATRRDDRGDERQRRIERDSRSHEHRFERIPLVREQRVSDVGRGRHDLLRVRA
jgi:tricorn protease